jgi:hypothetical protein
MNAKYTMSIDHPKKKLKEEIYMKAKGDCQNWVDSDQMVLGQTAGRLDCVSGGQRH